MSDAPAMLEIRLQAAVHTTHTNKEFGNKCGKCQNHEIEVSKRGKYSCAQRYSLAYANFRFNARARVHVSLTNVRACVRSCAYACVMLCP